MKKTINRERVSGRVYDHNLTAKITGETSKNPGTPYISGTLDIATDDACLNIVTVNYTYVTENTKNNTKNPTYTALNKIISEGKTILNDGMEAATMVKCDTALGLNDFTTDRAVTDTNPDGWVHSKRNDGGFVTIVSKLDAEDDRNKFEFDMLINGTRLVEANPEKHIDRDYLIVKGAVFNFRNSILPVELVVKNAGGMGYFESLEASSSNLVFTKVWGKIESQTIVDKREEETAFGEPAVKEYTRTVKEWVITGCAKEPYEIGDETTGITAEEIKSAMAERETYLADVKKRADEYQASKNNAIAESPATGVSAKAGAFNF